MKRLLWCLCLCSLCPTLVIGCGDDEPGGGSEDGGVEQDLREVTDRIDDAESRLDDLTGSIDGVSDKLDDLDDRFQDAGVQLDERLDALENPPILSCTDFEVCIPNGFEDVDVGIGGIIDKVCEHEIDCCNETELNLKFGPGIESVEDCKQLFTDMLENGFSPDFFGEYNSPYEAYQTPSVVYQVVGLVQALNDPRVRVEIDEEGVEACIESLEVECPDIPEPGETPDPECNPGSEYEEDPCSLHNLLNGLQDEGELCGAYSFGYGEDIPECKDGFYCSFEGLWNEQAQSQGICAKLPENGDFCQRDEDCDPFGQSSADILTAALPGVPSALVTDLYCNISSAQCEALGDVGDPCEFIDDSFTYYDEFNSINPQGREATSRDCKDGLTCDPSSKECVANCSVGRFCDPGPNPIYYCEEGLVCNVTEEPDLYDNYGLGTCGAALDVGDTCTEGFECESGACFDNCDVDTNLCSCNKAPGAECETPGQDESCSSGWCNTDNECAATCNCDPAQDGSCAGQTTVACDDGYYCDYQTLDVTSVMYVCEPLIANGTTCDTTFGAYPHSTCNSGYCDTELNQCAAKVAADAACPSNLDEQCRNTQYCNADLFCRTYRTEGQSCDLTDTSGLECADGLFCVNGTSSDTCQPPAQPGEDCDDFNVDHPPCDDSDPFVTCVDIDTADGAGTVSQCYSSQGGYADGVACPQGAHTYCASGWCRPDAAAGATEWTCEQPIEEGDECDTDNETMNVCGEGLYCDHPRDETVGTCTEQAGPGGECDPFFQGADCRFGGSCILTKDQYLCNADSLDYATELFCGG